MKIIKENVRRDITSCNFCKRGELNKGQTALIYPYESVLTFSSNNNGGGLCACICEVCLDELYKTGKQLFKQPTQ